MNSVYFDESGNTGQDILNVSDPVFALSSCRLDAEAEKRLLNHFKDYQGPELKYSRLRRGEKGKGAVLRFLEDPALNSQSAATVVFHKQFAAVTKYCDVVLEPSARQAGLNFYERGLNLATANLLNMTMPSLVGPQSWNSFLAAFVRVVRERSTGPFFEFVRLAELLFNYLEHTSRDAAHWIIPVLFLQREAFFNTLGPDELDLLVPAYYVLTNHWGNTLQEKFDIRADQSNVLIKERDRLLALGGDDIAPVLQGFDRRTMRFPLRVRDIIVVDSTFERQVQVADVLGGAIAGALKSKNRSTKGTYENQILRLVIERGIYLDGVWPGRDIDPKALGTDKVPELGRYDLPTYTAMVAQGHPETKK